MLGSSGQKLGNQNSLVGSGRLLEQLAVVWGFDLTFVSMGTSVLFHWVGK